MVLQREGIVGEVEAVEAIGDVLPIHQVFRMENNQARHSVHGGAGQIVVVTYTENIWVGELIVEQRIGIGAVAVVGRPRLGRSRQTCRGEERQE